MNRKIFFIYIFVLIFAPVAFGTVEDWSLAVMEVLSLLAAALLLLKAVRGNRSSLYEIPGLLPLLLLLSFMLAQLIPLPPELLRLISPGSYALYKKTIWVGGREGWASISLNRKAGLSELFRFASYAGFYIVSVQLLIRMKYIKKVLFVIAAVSSSLALIGILQLLISKTRIYGLRPAPWNTVPFGPYVNRNHFAGLIEMTFPLILSLFLYYKPRISYGSLREKVVDIFSQKRVNAHIILGFSAVLTATSVFLTLSRGGIASLSLSMIFFGAMLLTGRLRQRKTGLVVLVSFLVILAVGWFGWDPVFKKFAATFSPEREINDLRPVMWRDTLKIIRDFPLAGSGFGSYEDIYPTYETAGQKVLVEHAHNDYLELAATGGAVGSLLLISFFITVVSSSFRAYLRRREPYCIYLFIGSLTGMLAIAIHSLTDFNLQTGANGLYLFFLSGLTVSAAHTRFGEDPTGSYLRRLSPTGSFLKPAAAAAVLFLSANFLFYSGMVAARLQLELDKSAYAGAAPSGVSQLKDVLSRATLFDPLEPKYHYELAQADLATKDDRGALKEYGEAVRLDPASGEYQQALGLALAGGGEFDIAEKLLRFGIECDRNNPSGYLTYGRWLLSRKRRDEGVSNLKRAISLEPQRTREYIAWLVLSGETNESIRDYMPEETGAYLQFANYLDSTGDDSLAEEMYKKALDLCRNEHEADQSLFFRVNNFFAKRQRYDEALDAMRKGIELLPRNAAIRMAAAGLYEKIGVTYRAQEEYRQVLILNPGNREAIKSLQRLSAQ